MQISKDYKWCVAWKYGQTGPQLLNLWTLVPMKIIYQQLRYHGQECFILHNQWSQI